MKDSVLVYVPPYGFFGRRGGRSRRLGQLASRQLAAHVELTWIRGEIESDLSFGVTEHEAPEVEFHNSVAFDVASSVLETAGDGVVSLTHTATGSNRGAFAGESHQVPGSNTPTTSITYGGTGMTELWDFAPLSDRGHAGYAWPGGSTIPTGAQTVTSTIAETVPDFQVLGVTTMTGVDQTTPYGAVPTPTSGATTPATVTVASVGADDLVVDHVWISTNGGITIGADQTQRYSQPSGSQENRGSSQPGTAGGVMSWSISGESFLNWGIGAVAFKPLAGTSVTPAVGAGALVGIAPARVIGTVVTPSTP